MSLSSMSLGPETGATKALSAPMKGLTIDNFGGRFTIGWTFEPPTRAIAALTIEAAIIGLMLVGTTSVVGSIVVVGRG